MDNFVILNLEQFFNNNGFGNRDENQGDFTIKGLGSVFPIEELPSSLSIVSVETIPFLFPQKEEKNNFELNEQVINIDSSLYKKIHILCAADTGSFNEKIKVGNCKAEYEYKFGVSDWLSEVPCFSEKVAFRCSKIYTKKGEVNINATIWYQSVDISEINQYIKYIKFRDNPSVHIFSITLEKMEMVE